MIVTALGTIAVAATKTALIMGSTANIRPRIVRHQIATDGTPTSDQGIIVQIRRATALGTSTAVTFGFNDPSDSGVTLVVTAGSNCTVEPTYSGSPVDEYVGNPRFTYVWREYDRDAHIILPATASNGVGYQMTQAGGAAGNLVVTSWTQQ